MNGTDSLRPQIDRVQSRALIVGILAMLVCVLGAFSHGTQFYHSYLIAFLFWLGIALGCAAVLMLHHLVGGGWGLVIRGFLESGTRTIPLMALLMVPLIFGLPRLYSWTHTAPSTPNSLLHFRQTYLSVPFFIIRACLYFAVWIALAYFLNRRSSEAGSTDDGGALRRLRKLSGPGIALYGLTATFAATDWVMSLEPEWYSTAYGLLFIVGEVLTALAFVIGTAMLLAHREPLVTVISRQRLIDLGNLILTFVMLWAYISFAQFLIIWSGNLPEEISWYRIHFRGGWMAIVIALLLFHFALPFFLLLFRNMKSKARALALIAGAILLVRLADLWWIVTPTFHPGVRLHWMDVLAPVGIGGIWVAIFLRQLKGRPLVPAQADLDNMASISEGD